MVEISGEWVKANLIRVSKIAEISDLPALRRR